MTRQGMGGEGGRGGEGRGGGGEGHSAPAKLESKSAPMGPSELNRQVSPTTQSKFSLKPLVAQVKESCNESHIKL
jgi:hypothetical protein